MTILEYSFVGGAVIVLHHCSVSVFRTLIGDGCNVPPATIRWVGMDTTAGKLRFFGM